MSDIGLQVDSDRLVVDGSTGWASAHTYVTYRAARSTIRVRLQSRIGAAPWGDVPLPVVMLDQDGGLPRDYRSAGRFRSPELRPGEVYQVRAISDGDDPDAANVDTVVVMCDDKVRLERISA